MHFFGFSINLRTTIQLSLTGIISGFITGFVGLGSLVLLIAMLENLKLNIKSLMTSIALMAFCVTLLGVLLQELMETITWGNCIMLFVLTIIGMLFSIPLRKYFEKRLWMHRLIWSSLSNKKILIINFSVFYSILTILYVILWIVNIVKKTDRETDISPRNICG